jgi:hypothetical protein
VVIRPDGFFKRDREEEDRNQRLTERVAALASES